MPVRLSTAARNATVAARAALANAGAGSGVVKIFTGSQPASADTAATGTLLITWTLSDPAFGAASGGTASAASMPKSANAVASGTAGYARIEDSDGNSVADADIGTTGTPVTVSNTTIVSGSPYSLNSLTLSQPAG